jgi:hypothetical protein
VKVRILAQGPGDNVVDIGLSDDELRSLASGLMKLAQGGLGAVPSLLRLRIEPVDGSFATNVHFFREEDL